MVSFVDFVLFVFAVVSVKSENPKVSFINKGEMCKKNHNFGLFYCIFVCFRVIESTMILVGKDDSQFGKIFFVLFDTTRMVKIL